jgi:hypothetical protein
MRYTLMGIMARFGPSVDSSLRTQIQRGTHMYEIVAAGGLNQ